MAEVGPLKRSVLEVVNIKAIVYEETFTNVFRLDDVFGQLGELIVSFGAWPNVLTDEICQNAFSGSPELGNAGERIQKHQKSVFNFPLEFLPTYSYAVMWQSDAALLLIGPAHYLHAAKMSALCSLTVQRKR